MPEPGVRRAFATLDAIRGLAAACVMGFHYALLDEGLPIRFGNAFIDVDLFFCLSGFVLMQAYGSWARGPGGIFDFVLLRIVRLYPMYIIGSAIGLVAALVSSAGLSSDVGQSTVGIMTALFMLPDLGGYVPGGHGPAEAIYPLDLPAWSLFFEILANVGLVARIWGRWSLLAVASGAGAALATTVIVTRTINGGFDVSTMPVGLVRVAYAFPVGALLMILFKEGRLRSLSLHPLLPIAAVIALSAVVPVDRRADVAIVLVAVPLVIASATRDPRSRWALGACTWLGRISYPLYAIHYPVALLAMNVQGPHASPGWTVAGSAVFSVALADLLSRRLEPKLRQALSRALFRRPGPASA